MLMNAVPERIVKERKQLHTPSTNLYDFEQANYELQEIYQKEEDDLYAHLAADKSPLTFETIHPNDTIAQKRILRKNRENTGYGSKIRPKPYDPYEVAWNMNIILRDFSIYNKEDQWVFNLRIQNLGNGLPK